MYPLTRESRSHQPHYNSQGLWLFLHVPYSQGGCEGAGRMKVAGGQKPGECQGECQGECRVSVKVNVG